MKKKKDTVILILPLIAVLVLILGMIWAIDTIYRHVFRSDAEAFLIDDRFSETESSAETETQSFSELSGTDENREVNDAALELFTLPFGYTTERKPEESVHTGLLILHSSGSRMTDFQNRNEYYHLKTMNLQIQENAVRAMNALAEACFQETGKSNFLIYSTTELYQKEGSLYPDVLPDRSTGFCLDLAFLNEDGTFSVINEKNNFWLKENAWRFGFIFSIPEAEYHLRYVGKLHASVIHELNLTLEAYLEMLREYSVYSPYQYRMEEKSMLIYFVPGAAFGSTDIPVPEDKDYEISGNDADGFIVWTVNE